MRVRSYVREEPVSEKVTLRDERVVVERRAVDRPLRAEEETLGEWVIKAEEFAEEAVVSKQARVVEEIGLRKDVEQHSQTISDKVRHTEIEVDDERGTTERDTSRRP